MITGHNNAFDKIQMPNILALLYREAGPSLLAFASISQAKLI